MKNFYLSPALALVLTCLLIIPIITLVSPATTSDAVEFSSAVITEDRNEIDFELEPRFNVELDASYGDFDTNNDGTADFKGIAVDMRVTNISTSLAYGIAGIDARLCFDNTKLEPLFKTSEELNGKGLNSPAPLTNFPTYPVRIPAAGLVLDVFSVEGLCKAYAHTDGSYVNPENPHQIFTGPESYISCNYVINIETHVAYKNNKTGLVSSDNVSFRYYFKLLDESGAGGEYTFTVPDSPNATAISAVMLKAPYYTGATDSSPSFSNVPGRGDSVTLKLWNSESTTAEVTTKAPEVTTKAPEVTTKVPEVTTKVPEVTTKVPEVTTKVPEVTTKSPEVTTKAPEVTTKVPDVTTKVPEVTTKAPEVTTKVPEVTTKVPDVTTQVPEVTTDISGEVTTETAPTESTTEPTSSSAVDSTSETTYPPTSDTTAPPNSTTDNREDIVTPHESTTLSPESEAPADTSADDTTNASSDYGSCSSFAASASLSLVLLIPTSLLIIRMEKSNDKKKH